VHGELTGGGLRGYERDFGCAGQIAHLVDFDVRGGSGGQRGHGQEEERTEAGEAGEDGARQAVSWTRRRGGAEEDAEKTSEKVKKERGVSGDPSAPRRVLAG